MIVECFESWLPDHHAKTFFNMYVHIIPKMCHLITDAKKRRFDFETSMIPCHQIGSSPELTNVKESMSYKRTFHVDMKLK